MVDFNKWIFALTMSNSAKQQEFFDKTIKTVEKVACKVVLIPPLSCGLHALNIFRANWWS